MKWVKDITGMNYFWLTSNCILFFCFRLSLLVYLSFVVVLLLPCSLLYTFNFCYNMCPQFCSVSSFFLVLYFYCSHDVFLFLSIFQYSLFWYFFFCWRWCSPVPPQSSIQVRPAIHLLRPFLSFSIYPPSFFSSCFLFWRGYSAIRTSLQFSRPNSSNDFIELGWCLWGFVLFVGNLYNFFYVLPFFDIIFQLLNLYPYIVNHLFVT